MSRNRWLVVLACGAAVTLAGCATKSYVQEQVAASTTATNAKLGEVQTQVETTQAEVATLKGSDEQQNTQLTELSGTAKDALDRAQQAGKLAQGKLLYEVVLSDDSVRFPLDSSELSSEAKAALSAFAAKLKQENQNVYIEIQGFTDSTGASEWNLELGRRRAEAVMRHLSIEEGIPLHRINVISYGEEKPIADNKTRAGRAQNRRVALVVLA